MTYHKSSINFPLQITLQSYLNLKFEYKILALGPFLDPKVNKKKYKILFWVISEIIIILNHLASITSKNYLIFFCMQVERKNLRVCINMCVLCYSTIHSVFLSNSACIINVGPTTPLFWFYVAQLMLLHLVFPEEENDTGVACQSTISTPTPRTISGQGRWSK